MRSEHHAALLDRVHKAIGRTSGFDCHDQRADRVVPYPDPNAAISDSGIGASVRSAIGTASLLTGQDGVGAALGPAFGTVAHGSLDAAEPEIDDRGGEQGQRLGDDQSADDGNAQRPP